MRVSGEKVGNAVGVERSGEPFRTRDPGAVSHPTMITPPVLRINDHATGGRRTKDILGGPKSLETKKLGSSKG